MTENPWIQLPGTSPYAPVEDRPVLEAFNARASADHLLHTELLPEPYLGQPEAPIVLLGSNASFSDQDLVAHADPQFRRLSLTNLLHGDLDYPFFLLDPSLAALAPGHAWWNSKLRALIEAAGLEAVARHVFYAAWLPYHSCWQGFNGALPSQQYTFELVRQAIARDAVVVLLRGTTRWAESVAELAAYSPHRRLIKVRNPQNPALSPNNLGHDSFDLLVETLRAADQTFARD